MYDHDEHLENLMRHIAMVRKACTLLGKRLAAQERSELGRHLIARGHVHDASKFYGIEWDYLHRGPDTPAEELQLAIKQHTRTNSHHPEFHGGLCNMPELDIAEMVCDWYARGQEFGTGLREWISDSAIGRYNIDLESRQYHWINNFVDQLLKDPFRKETTNKVVA
jgi:hypothetical protein